MESSTSRIIYIFYHDRRSYFIVFNGELLNVKYREFINFGLEVINNSSPESKQKILDFYFTENREFIETALASHNKSKNE